MQLVLLEKISETRLRSECCIKLRHLLGISVLNNNTCHFNELMVNLDLQLN